LLLHEAFELVSTQDEGEVSAVPASVLVSGVPVSGVPASGPVGRLFDSGGLPLGSWNPVPPDPDPPLHATRTPNAKPAGTSITPFIVFMVPPFKQAERRPRERRKSKRVARSRRVEDRAVMRARVDEPSSGDDEGPSRPVLGTRR
jgi:hypothetical protein